MKNCVIFSCHRWDECSKARFDRIKEETKGLIDCYINFDTTFNTPPKGYDNCLETFNPKSVSELGFKLKDYYPVKFGVFYGHNFEYSFMHFYLNHKNYDFYWVIEFDVTFTGNWFDFFKSFEEKNEDLITNFIRLKSEDQNWVYWSLPYSSSIEFSETDKMHSFNPIFRISNKALESYTNFAINGNYGFYEFFLPTFLNKQGFSLKQFGGDIKNNFCYDDINFVCGINQDTLTDNLTFYYLPKVHIEYENKLYHPFKTLTKYKNKLI